MSSVEKFVDLKALLEPKTIAVIGASEKDGPGSQVIMNLRKLGYSGKILPVNPKYETVLGIKCYPSLSAVYEAGHSVDLAALVLGKDWIIPVLKEAGALGVKAAWAFATGFGEAGEEGKERQRELIEVCHENNIQFCGPNCVGYLNFNKNTGAYSAPAPLEIKRGNIGVVGQSGYLCITMANSHRGLGFSMLCSTGNEAVLDSTDYIAHMLEDEDTDVVMAFIEQFRKPDRLYKLAERARELKKPIIVIKVGRSAMAQRATVAHTGALAGSDDVQDEVLKKLGIIRVNDLDELYETAALFSGLKRNLPKGNGLFSITTSGGVISLIADLSEDLKLDFPSWSDSGRKKIEAVMPPYAGIDNPLDAWGWGRLEENYYPCVAAAASEPGSDLVLVSQDIPPGMDEKQTAQYMIVARAAVKAKEEFDKPVVFISNPSTGFSAEIAEYLAENSIPLLQGTRAGIRALDKLFNYVNFLKKKKPENKGTLDRKMKELMTGTKEFTEYTAKKVLAGYGVPCTKELLCKTEDELIAAAEEIGYPVAVKIMSPQILHKTEAGIIRLKIGDKESLIKAAREIMANAIKYCPDGQIDGYLCQQMAGAPVAEAIAGILIDSQFGPAVVFGMGGIMVEILKDSALGIPPLSKEDALEMIRKTKGSKLLEGFRGRPKGDIDALADVLIKLGDFALDWQDRLEALDINPLLVMPEGSGVIAVDGLLTIK